MKDFIKSIVMFCLVCLFFYGCSMPADKVRVVEIKQGQEKELPDENLPQENPANQNEEPLEKEVENNNETEQGKEKETEKENESETDSEPESNPESNPESEQGSENKTETESESGQEAEIEPEPEPEPLPELDPMKEMPDPAKLTLVVYMAADNDLESYAVSNLKAMEHAEFENMNVLVLLDRAEGFDETNGDWTDTRLFELVHDETDGNLIVSRRISCPLLGLSNRVDTELDMGNPSVLWNLLSFAKNNYESDKYALIIWGHGTGWRYSAGGDAAGLSGGAGRSVQTAGGRAVAVDDRSGSYMSVHDMGRALKGQGFSVVGFDTCFGGVFENVYEIKNYADYTVASPGITPSGGWNYKQLLEDLSDSNFHSKTIAEAMAESSSVNATVFNNVKLNSLMNEIEGFSEALTATITSSATRNAVYDKLIRVKSYSYTQYPCDLYLDIYSIAQAYQSSSVRALATASDRLMRAVNNAASSTKSNNAEIGLHFIPKTGPNTSAASHSSDYIKDSDNADQCQFIKESMWWVPTKGGESGSLLDRLFYEMF